MVVRGEVYRWDGEKATGSALYESAPRRIAFVHSSYHKESFAPAALAVEPGAQYVIFASVDKDFKECMPTTWGLSWGFIEDDVYRGGYFVFQNNQGDEGQWTTAPWGSWNGAADAAFTASLSP
jgi:hypothetical protein